MTNLQQIEKLREALKKYGQHLAICPLPMQITLECTCGFDQALLRKPCTKTVQGRPKMITSFGAGSPEIHGAVSEPVPARSDKPTCETCGGSGHQYCPVHGTNSCPSSGIGCKGNIVFCPDCKEKANANANI